jgi:fluoroacetyl-CoA thioesterase
MKSTLAAGLSAHNRFEIDRSRTIDFMGEAARVYATPMLVRDIEMTCRDLMLQHLDAGEDSVGTRVEIDHIGATLLGMTVELSVRIAEVNGRSVVFEVEGRDTVEPIVRGRHTRFVVDVAKTQQRLAAKADKARTAGPLA